MTPFKLASKKVANILRNTGMDKPEDISDFFVIAVLSAFRSPIANASDYLKADAEAWEMGAKDTPHEVYLMHSGKLRRGVAKKLDAILAVLGEEV